MYRSVKSRKYGFKMLDTVVDPSLADRLLVFHADAISFAYSAWSLGQLLLGCGRPTR